MTDTTDAPDDYLTITPFGVVHALFGYDPGVTLQGPEDAVACVTRAIEGSMNAMGIGLTLDSVEPADYFNFCQGHGTGVLIIEPTEVELLPPMPEEPQATEIEAALDSAEVSLGEAFTDKSGDPEGAIALLMAQRSGNVPAAWTRPDVGPIDIVWGNDRIGLAKIAAKHPEGIKKLPDLLRHGKLHRLPGGKTALLVDDKVPNHVTVLKLDWYGTAKTWVLTSYDDEHGRFAGGPALIDTKTLDSAGMNCSPADQQTNLIVNPEPDMVNNAPATPAADEAMKAAEEAKKPHMAKTPGDDFMDEVEEDDEGDEEDEAIADEDNFDAAEEFEATPGAEDGEMPTMDGDYKGHPFRGNGAVAAGHESRGAVHSSMRAKRAEQKGSQKEQRTAHRAAAHAHKAAGAFATGKSKAYHQIMAKFHGERARAKAKAKMDSAVLDAADFNALRASLASASGVMARLAAAQAIHAARVAAPESEAPLRTRGDIVLDALKTMGWTESRWGPDVLVRSFVGMGRTGTVVTPDGVRNVYARVTDGTLVVKFGDDTIASASLAGTDAEVEATAGTVNAQVEAFAAAESARANPPAVENPAKAVLSGAGFVQTPSMPGNWVKAVLADGGKVKHLYGIREFGPEGSRQYRATRSTSFPGTGVTGAPTQDLGTFNGPDLAVSAVNSDMKVRLKNEPAVTPEPEPAAAGPKFRYALMNRPADSFALPKGLSYTVEPRPAKGQPHYDMARHGILVTDRELTAAECKNFELAPLVDGADLGVLAEKIATGAMAEYANSYVEMATDEPQAFRGMVMQAVERSSSGVVYSIGDPDALVQMVLDKLKASIPAAIVTPEPTVTPPATDPVREADMSLLSMVAAGTHPDMLEPELADQIEAVMTRYPDDADIQAAAEKAITAYSNGMMAASEKL